MANWLTPATPQRTKSGPALKESLGPYFAGASVLPANVVEFFRDSPASHARDRNAKQLLAAQRGQQGLLRLRLILLLRELTRWRVV